MSDMCPMCAVASKDFLIQEYSHWRVEVHSNQSYLGRLMVIANRHFEDITDVNEDEWNELSEVMKSTKIALSKSFAPNKINYSSLGNEVSHVHIHIIPRYQKAVEFKGILFDDLKWGYNPYPYDKNFKLSNEVFEEIKNLLQSSF